MHLDLCDDLVRRALAQGAAGAEVFYRRARKLEAMFEKNDLQVPKGEATRGDGAVGDRRRQAGSRRNLRRVAEELFRRHRHSPCPEDAKPPPDPPR